MLLSAIFTLVLFEGAVAEKDVRSDGEIVTPPRSPTRLENTGFGPFIEGATFHKGDFYATNFGDNEKKQVIGKLEQDSTMGSAITFAGCETNVTDYHSILWVENKMYLANSGDHTIDIVENGNCKTFCKGFPEDFPVPNDFVIDKNGRAYVSGHDWGRNFGALWTCSPMKDKASKAKQVLGPFLGTNGIALGPEEKYLYLEFGVRVEMPQAIWKIEIPAKKDIESPGKWIKNVTVLIARGCDGMKIRGHKLYIAARGEGKVMKYDIQNAKLEDVFKTKIRDVSTLAFNEAGDLYVTGNCGTEWGPEAGCVEIFKKVHPVSISRHLTYHSGDETGLIKPFSDEPSLL